MTFSTYKKKKKKLPESQIIFYEYFKCLSHWIFIRKIIISPQIIFDNFLYFKKKNK